MPHKYLIKEFEELAHSSASVEPLMQHVCERIHTHIPRYNWIGFYLVDKKAPDWLVLGPHTGSFTPKARISFYEGLCGRAAASGKVMVSHNVEQDPRCLRASDIVKSQVAVPVTIAEKVVAVFHVESYFVAAFKPEQEYRFVESCARIVAGLLESSVVRDLVNA